MKNIGRRLLSLKEYLALCLAMIISLILLNTNENDQVNILRLWLLEASGTFHQKIIFFKKILSTYEENIELKKQNAKLMLESIQYKEILLENIRFRKLIGLRQKNEFELIPTIVIGHGASQFTSTILLDAGKNQGVQQNMPIVTADGLVGKIVTVGSNYSEGQILLDRNFRVSAKIQRTRLNGIVRWTNGTRCIMDGIPRRADVQKGDVVITSGYSSIFPAGLKIGVVIECADTMNELFKKVIIQSRVDFNKLEEVFIIRFKPQ